MTNKLGRFIASAGIVVTLSSCGGGEGSGSVMPQPAATTPPTSPVQTPTPTPAPTSYASATDYSANFDFTSSIGYASDRFMPNQGGVSIGLGVYLLPEDQSTRLVFAAQPETVRFSYAGAEAVWAGSERQTGSGQRSYARDMDRLALGFISAVKTTYVTEAIWLSYMGAMDLNGVAGRRSRVSVGIVGAATSTADIPASSVEYRGASYTLGGLQSDQFSGRVDTTARVDLRYGGAVAGSFALYDSNALSPADQAISVLLTGQLDRATGVLTGTLNSVPQGFTGTFRGRLFGPAGQEVGLAFRVQRPSDRAEVVGEFIGSR